MNGGRTTGTRTVGGDADASEGAGWGAEPIDPKATHALVVGIDRYAAGRTWDLEGPSRDALRFTRYLLDRGVPAGNVRLCISADDCPSLGVPVHRADKRSIHHVLFDDLSNAHGDLLVVFWGGHGICVDTEGRRQLYADATEEQRWNLHIDSFLRMLRSVTFRGPKRQMLIFDSCANQDSSLSQSGALPVERFAYGPRDGRAAQFVLYSTREGQRARELTDERAGLFSRELQALLDASTAWPPDVDEVTRALRDRFRALAISGAATQTPVHLWWRDWSDNEDRVAAQIGVTTASRALGAKVLPSALLDDLFEQLDGIPIEARHAETAYRACAPSAWPWPRDVLALGGPLAIERMARLLADAPPGAGGGPPLLDFVEHAILLVKASTETNATWLTLRDWLSIADDALGISEEIRAARRRRAMEHVMAPRTREVSLAVCVSPVTVGRYDVAAYVIRDGRSAERLGIDETSIASLDQLPAVLDEVCASAPDVEPKALTIELLLPVEMLDCDADAWLLSYPRVPVGSQYPLVLRSWDRAYCKRLAYSRRLWRDHWRVAKERETITWYDGEAARAKIAIALRLQHEKCGRVVLDERPARPVLDDIVQSGAPVVLWPRCNGAAEWLRRFATESTDWRLRVLEARLAAAVHNEHDAGRHISLLWDDPERIPPAPSGLAAPQSPYRRPASPDRRSPHEGHSR